MASESRLPSSFGPGSIIGERYRLVRLIGEGGMGAVFEAETQNGARVAVKLLVVGEGAAMAEARARFLRESALSFSLRAAHVVAVHDHGVDARSGVPFMTMDLLVGEDLDALVRRVGALEPSVVVKLFVQACEGLAAAHARGIVHRDVKPSNLFLCRLPDGTIDLKVCDFGAAKIFGAEALTRAGALVGTPLFIPPEQLRNAKEADARSDVWSLGMSMYFALTGSPALEHVKSFSQLASILVAGDIPHLQVAAPWIDGHLARIVHGTILTSVDARCPSARDLGALLTRLARLAPEGPIVSSSSLAPVGAATRESIREIARIPVNWNEVVATTPIAPPPIVPSPTTVARVSAAPVPADLPPRRHVAIAVAIALGVTVAGGLLFLGVAYWLWSAVKGR